jgi:protein-tyrosine sulfotransferase
MSEQPFEGVVILGFPRSGTTMLRRMLESHPQLCCPPETHILRACAAFMREDDFPMGYSLGVLTSLRFVGVEPEQVIERLRGLALGLWRDICAASGKPIWVEKSAFDFFHVDAIERLLGHRCRYIWLSRNPTDVIASLKDYVGKVEVYPSELHDYVRREPIPPLAFAQAWADAQRRMAGFAQRLGEDCLRVRYEELVAEPEAQLGRIQGFIGVEGDPAALLEGLASSTGAMGFGDWKTYGRIKVSDESVGRAKDFPPRLLARLGEILNPVMTELGYEPITVSEKALKTDPVKLLKMAHSIRHTTALREAKAAEGAS